MVAAQFRIHRDAKKNDTHFITKISLSILSQVKSSRL